MKGKDWCKRFGVQALPRGPEGLQHYADRIEEMEAAMWASGRLDKAMLAHYQALCREMEAHVGQRGNDRRHHFIVIIPLADRPEQLRMCLHSLWETCLAFEYGGRDAQGYLRKVSVLIADDSRDLANIQRQKAIAAHFERQGLPLEYFDHARQHMLLQALPESLRAGLQPVVGLAEQAGLGHKGPSVMRNITYLRLMQIVAANRARRHLFFFIDSDQVFGIEDECGSILPAINYFYHLDRVFCSLGCHVFTGKVVGDPPVSPAVMAGRFLDDVELFLQVMRQQKKAADCTFHRRADVDEGSYHDLGELFGLRTAMTAYRYVCPLPLPHDHGACFSHFAFCLQGFFDGEHPTRSSGYHYRPVLESLEPARTVYTGNYVLSHTALSYFIPFASLRLRMAGPVLGRIMRAELGKGFVSGNLPLTHKRTLATSKRSEFRPGVAHLANRVDLQDEFERQFFGDVMLFGMERLIALGYPQKPLSHQRIYNILHETEKELRTHYRKKQARILQKLKTVQKLFADEQAWWQHAEFAKSRSEFTAFFANIAHNHGPSASMHRILADDDQSLVRRQAMLQALLNYPEVRQCWQQVLQILAADNRS